MTNVIAGSRTRRLTFSEMQSSWTTVFVCNINDSYALDYVLEYHSLIIVPTHEWINEN